MAMKELDFNVSDGVSRLNFQIIRDEINTKAKISSGSGAPSGGSAGDLYVDTAADRLYVNVAGTWKYATLA